jgi:NAD(P)H-dependent flavin oxidoreductase YrpB (nitropropane dioxygenase family)
MGQKALREGALEAAIIPCGQCVGLIREIKSVREVIEEITDGAEALLEKLNAMKPHEQARACTPKCVSPRRRGPQ